MTHPEKKAGIPPFRSDQGEREFWARHSVEKFAKGLTDLEIEIRPPRTEQIAVRLYKEDLEVLRSLAAARGVGHTTLARTVLEGWLAWISTDRNSPKFPGHRRQCLTLSVEAAARATRGP